MYHHYVRMSTEQCEMKVNSKEQKTPQGATWVHSLGLPEVAQGGVVTPPAEYDSTQTYSVGDFVTYNDNIYMCNIGDSKGFVMKDGKFIYETKTHNIAEMYYKVPLDFVRFHPKSNVVVYSLGLDRINVGACVYSDTIPMDRNSEYQVTLCSDGVTDCLSRKQIWEIASKSDNVARDLVDASLDSKSSFKQELEKSKRKFGIIGRQSFRVLVDYLKNRDMGIDYENVIIGGKDNTTAVSGTFRR